MSQLNDSQQRGLKVLGEMLGDKAAEIAAARAVSGDTGGAMTAHALSHVFDGIWSRPELDRRSRSLVTIGALIAARAEHELGNHFRIAIRHGVTPRELEEAVLQSLPYVGFSAAGPAMAALTHVLRDLGLDTKSRTAAEQGLL